MELVSIPENPIPDGAICGEIRAADGVRLRFARWPAPEGKGRGTVCLFHGRSEFIEKYFETISDLRRRNLEVATLDWRGQGGSQRLLRDPRKGYVDDFSKYLLDLKAFMHEVVLPDCRPPHFALAHSTGGLVLLQIARDRTFFDRMVLSAPLVGFAMTPMQRRLALAVSVFLDYLGLGDRYVPGGSGTAVNTEPFADNPLTSDEARYRRTRNIIEAAPHLGLGAPTIGWVHAAARAMRNIESEEYAFEIKIPTLIVSAGADSVVSNSAIEDLAASMRIGRNIVIPGARHELMMERDIYRQQFLAAFDSFIPGT